MSDAVELDMKVDGRILVTCQFCSAVHVFDEGETAALAAR